MANAVSAALNTDMPSVFHWDDQLLVGHPSMDDTHREFVDCLNALLQAPDEGLLPALDAFIVHARAHFGEEDESMRQTEFPPRDCHIEEHAKVLASVLEVRDILHQQGNVKLCRELAKALYDWFPGHVQQLDSALATWMVNRTHGGRPLVFRRKAT